MSDPVRMRGDGDMMLVGDGFGPPAGQPVVLLHGGGQTRHAWGDTAAALGELGFRVLAIDQRGHGDSDWALDGDYRVQAYAADLVAIADQLDRPPAVVGASLGGMAALLAQASHPALATAVVLVDIAPRIEPAGVQRILAFMTAHPDGFGSLAEAGDAVAAYLPHRPRPDDLSGLAKNLRIGADGRYRWHWDPRFLDHRSRGPSVTHTLLAEAARRLSVPTLLVRGALSDVLSPDAVREFLALVPHAQYADVAAAAHMIAGDRNDRFTHAIIDFLRGVFAPAG
jgi:non-heme chloroperoxidase